MSALASGPLDLVALRPQAGTQAFFRHRAIGDKVLITGFEGTSTLTSWDPERGTATFELTWNPPLDVR